MNGLINQQMDGGAPPPSEATPPQSEALPPQAEAQLAAVQPEEGAATGKLTITPDGVMRRMHLKPKQIPQMQRIVTAGMKVMFSQQTRKLITAEMQKPGDVASKLGESVAGLMGILLQQSKGSMPLDLVIPAGLVLVAHAADFAHKIGAEVTDADIGDACEIFIHVILHMSGMSSDKVAAVGEKGVNLKEGVQEAVTGEEPTDAPLPPPTPSGMIASQMGPG